MISWNITGLNTKLNGTLFSRSDFLRFIKRSDIVCLTETWAGINDKYYIQGYSEYSVIRKKHVKAKKNSGGISIFVRTTLTKYITEIKSKSRNILWLHINFKKLHAKFNLLLGVIYVSPESSPIHAEENIFQILTDDLLRLKAKYTDVKTLITGDFNAYTACESDFLDNALDKWDIFHENQDDNIELPKRYNSDIRDVNKQGRELLNFCINTNMCIANGRIGLDKQIGDFTCYFGKYPSVIDYVICDTDFLSCFKDFYIANRMESHHLPICFTLEIGRKTMHENEKNTRMFFKKV